MDVFHRLHRFQTLQHLPQCYKLKLELHCFALKSVRFICFQFKAHCAYGALVCLRYFKVATLALRYSLSMTSPWRKPKLIDQRDPWRSYHVSTLDIWDLEHIARQYSSEADSSLMQQDQVLSGCSSFLFCPALSTSGEKNGRPQHLNHSML